MRGTLFLATRTSHETWEGGRVQEILYLSKYRGFEVPGPSELGKMSSPEWEEEVPTDDKSK